MSAKEIRVKDLVRLLNIAPSYASEILSGKKGVSEENMKKIKEEYPSINFKIFTKLRYKIEKEQKKITAQELFKKLNYEFIDNSNREIDILKNYQYIGNEKDMWQEIIFNFNDKTIDIYKCCGVKQINSKIVCNRSNISTELLQAINKQVSELGWNK